MSAFIVVCDTPVAGDSVSIDGVQWFYLEDPIRVWRGPIGNENTVAMQDETALQLADALNTGLLVDGLSSARNGAVVTIQGVESVVTTGRSFTVQEDVPAAPVTSAFKDQMTADLDVFLNLDEFAETWVVNGKSVVCLMSDEQVPVTDEMGQVSFETVRKFSCRESDLDFVPQMGKWIMFTNSETGFRAPLTVKGISRDGGMLTLMLSAQMPA